MSITKITKASGEIEYRVSSEEDLHTENTLDKIEISVQENKKTQKPRAYRREEQQKLLCEEIKEILLAKKVKVR